MKKIFSVLVVYLIAVFSLCAEEKVFLQSDSFNSQNVAGYSYENWEIKPQSSLSGTETQLKYTSGYLAAYVEVPETRFVYYDIIPPYNPVLTEADGTFGYITNVGAIKSISITVNGINRDDTVSIFLATDPNDKVGKEYKFTGNLETIGETTLVWNNPNYIEDPAKRNLTILPAYGGKNSTDLYIRSIRIRSRPITGYNASIVYFKDMKVIFDKAYTDEQLETIKATDELFEKSSNSKSEIKARETEKLTVKAALLEQEKAKIATEGTRSEN